MWMNWLQRISQVNDLQQMLTQVASGIGVGGQGVPDVGSVAQYVANLGPDPSVCEMINTVGRSYPGSEASMGRIARAAGCQFDPNSEENANMVPGMNSMLMPPVEKSMEMPSIEIE